MEKVKKETFIYILNILKNDDFIDYSIDNNINSIEVRTLDGDWTDYSFDCNDYFIDPQIEDLVQEIVNLEDKKKELEKKKYKY